MMTFSPSLLRIVALVALLFLAKTNDHVTQALDSEKVSGSLRKEGNRHLLRGLAESSNVEDRALYWDDYIPPDRNPRPGPPGPPGTHLPPSTGTHPGVNIFLLCEFYRRTGRAEECPL